ncbi:hypothetical protein [Thermococcus sp.]
MLDIVKERLEEGDVEGALKFALDAGNPLITVEILSLILKYVRNVEDYNLVLACINDAINGITDPIDRVKALSAAAEALYSTGAEMTGWHYFEEAVHLAEGMELFKWRADALAHIAGMMILAGLVDDAYHYYTRAVEVIERSGEPYSAVVSMFSALADAIMEGADHIHDRRALKFYSLARDIHLIINKRLTASMVNEKIRTIEDVLKEGSVAVTKFLEIGDIDKAVFAVRYLQDEEKPVALMNVAYWLFLHGQERLARVLLKDAYDMMFLQDIRPKDIALEGVAYRLIKLGLLDDALNIAGIIKDEEISDRVLGRIALMYARRGDKLRAEEILDVIKNESVKSKILKAIWGERNVGHE